MSRGGPGNMTIGIWGYGAHGYMQSHAAFGYYHRTPQGELEWDTREMKTYCGLDTHGTYSKVAEWSEIECEACHEGYVVRELTDGFQRFHAREDREG